MVAPSIYIVHPTLNSKSWTAVGGWVVNNSGTHFCHVCTRYEMPTWTVRDYNTNCPHRETWGPLIIKCPSVFPFNSKRENMERWENWRLGTITTKWSKTTDISICFVVVVVIFWGIDMEKYAPFISDVMPRRPWLICFNCI